MVLKSFSYVELSNSVVQKNRDAETIQINVTEALPFSSKEKI